MLKPLLQLSKIKVRLSWLVPLLTLSTIVIGFSEEQKKGEGEEEPLTGKDEEERRIAEMGRPMLGDHVKLEVIIEESYEFKVWQGRMRVGVLYSLKSASSFWQTFQVHTVFKAPAPFIIQLWL